MQVILLIIAVSVDVFVACVACGSEQIKIGSAAALCISTVCSGILGISLYAGMALPVSYTHLTLPTSIVV